MMIFYIAAAVLGLYGIIGFLLIYFHKATVRKFFLITLYLFGIGVFAGAGTYFYVFHKPHRNIEKEQPAFKMNATDLLQDFTNNEDSSYVKYGDKVLEIKGDIADIILNDNGATVVLIDAMTGINCAFDSLAVSQYSDKLHDLKIGQPISIKGKCDGYDMIMGVVLSRCFLVE